MLDAFRPQNLDNQNSGAFRKQKPNPLKKITGRSNKHSNNKYEWHKNSEQAKTNNLAQKQINKINKQTNRRRNKHEAKAQKTRQQ